MIVDHIKINDKQAKAIQQLAYHFGQYTKVNTLGIKVMFLIYKTEIIRDSGVGCILESRGIVYFDVCDGSMNFYIQHELFID